MSSQRRSEPGDSVMRISDRGSGSDAYSTGCQVSTVSLEGDGNPRISYNSSSSTDPNDRRCALPRDGTAVSVSCFEGLSSNNCSAGFGDQTSSSAPLGILKRIDAAQHSGLSFQAPQLVCRSADRRASPLEEPDQGDMHRACSGVRFQLPRTPPRCSELPIIGDDSNESGCDSSATSPNRERSGLLAGLWRLIRGRHAESSAADMPALRSVDTQSCVHAACEADLSCTLETSLAANGVDYATSVESGGESGGCDGGSASAKVCEGSAQAENDISRVFHSFTAASESSATEAREGCHGSPKRFDGSASPMGSFYFAGNSQVYIPDAPDDIMDIPSNQSFVGGGSFCSSPVVISNRLKTVGVSHNLQVLNDRYVIYMDKLIGSGSFGEVHLCYSIEEEIYYAVKVLNRRQLVHMGIGTGVNGMEKLLNEIAIMMKLRHENIIALKEVINDSGANTVYLILELAGYGPLLRLENGFVEPDCEGNTCINEGTVQELVHSMVQALVYAHQEGVAHRDIKPDNLLLTSDSQLKVSDFGVSCLVDKQRTLDREGSIAFLPPEMLLPLTKEKFIAPSPHVSAMVGAEFDNDEDQGFGVFESSSQSMAPLSMEASADSFPQNESLRRASDHPSGIDTPSAPLRISTDNVLLTPESRPVCGKLKRDSASQSVQILVPDRKRGAPGEPFCSRDEPDLVSPLNRCGSRARFRSDDTRDGVTSPHNSSFIRTPKVGWRPVNRNEIDLFKADVWALGVTAFVMLHGRLPWLAHLEPIARTRGDDCDAVLEDDNNITECLDPQSRFRLSLYQKWRSRQERPLCDSQVDEPDHSYLSPYRLGNSSFAKLPGDLIDAVHRPDDSKVENGDMLSRSVTDSLVIQGVDKEDKQNVEYAFWKYWSSLVQGSHLGEHQPTAATEKQLRAILCHPDPVTLLHTSSSLQKVDDKQVPKTHSWEVFASSDDEGDFAEFGHLGCDSTGLRRDPADPAAPGLGGSRRGRARSIKVADDIDVYLARQKSRFGGPLGKCATCSSSATSFIRECLQLDPVVRPAMSDLLQHPWLSGVRAAHEQKQRDTQLTGGAPADGVFGDIPVVNLTSTAGSSGVDVHPLASDSPADAGGDGALAVPTQTSARPIAREEIDYLPKHLPLLFNNVANKAGWLKASTGQVAFSNLRPVQRRAADDSALFDIRQRQLSEVIEQRWSRHRRVFDGSPCGAAAYENGEYSELQKPSSPIRMFLTATKGSMPPRSLSLPLKLDELQDSLALFENGQALPPPPVIRKRTNTMAPVMMPTLSLAGDELNGDHRK